MAIAVLAGLASMVRADSASSASTDRKRYFTLSDERLVLRPAPPLTAGVKEWIVEWEHVAK